MSVISGPQNENLQQTYQPTKIAHQLGRQHLPAIFIATNHAPFHEKLMRG